MHDSNASQWPSAHAGKHGDELMSAVAQAIARHKAAQAEVDAAYGSGDASEFVSDAAYFALCDLAETPCADAAELFEKLRYLLTHEKSAANSGSESYRPILIALELHLNALNYG